MTYTTFTWTDRTGGDHTEHMPRGYADSRIHGLTERSRPVRVLTGPWVVIEREHDEPLYVGPYASDSDAMHALDHSLLIDGLCETDALDAYIRGHIPDVSAPAVLVIDPDNPDHTGR